VSSMSENKVLSIPKLLFEWTLDYGTIRVYHITKYIVAITFDHNIRDEVYGQIELQGTPHFDAISLVYQAVYNYHTQIPEGNPFIQLLEEPELMEQLANIFQKIWSGE